MDNEIIKVLLLLPLLVVSVFYNVNNADKSVFIDWRFFTTNPDIIKVIIKNNCIKRLHKIIVKYFFGNE